MSSSPGSAKTWRFDREPDADPAAPAPAAGLFFRYELPRIGAWLGVVETRDDTCRSMTEDAF